MKGKCFVLALAVVCLAAARGWGQTQPGEVQRLRQQIQALSEKLQAVESGQKDRQRVTELGGGRARQDEPVLVVRIYDLSDLFSLAPPYPATQAAGFGDDGRPLFSTLADRQLTGAVGIGGMGGMGGMGGFGMGAAAPTGGPGQQQPTPPHILPQQHVGGTMGATMDAARTSIDDLIEAITSVIAPEQWDDVGGPCSIARLGTALLVSATEPIHAQIDALMGALREHWKTLRTISVQADWLWLSDDQLDGLLSTGAQGAKADEPRAFGLVADEPWANLKRQIAEKGDEHPAGYQAVITGYNGQTVHVVSGGQRRFIVSMIPVVGGSPEATPERAVGYQPQVTTIQDGASLQVTPMASTSGKFVVLDVHSQVVQLHETPPSDQPTNAPVLRETSTVRELAAAIDRPLVKSHRLATTVRIPAGRRMLVGGMTFEGQPQPGGLSLYLFTKVSVQELRDDTPQPKPAAPAARAKLPAERPANAEDPFAP